MLVEASFVDNSARVAEADIKAGLAGRSCNIGLYSSFLGNLVTQHGQSTTSTATREDSKAVEAAALADVVGGFFEGEAGATPGEATKAHIVGAFA